MITLTLFGKKELALNQRKNIESCDDIQAQQDIQAQDLQAFESFNATHKAMLDSMLHQQTDTESARKYALEYWDNLLRDKKQKWLKSMKRKTKRTIHSSIKRLFRPSFIHFRNFTKSLWLMWNKKA